MTNAWPWLGSARESGEPFAMALSLNAAAWKAVGAEKQRRCPKVSNVQAGKGPVVRQADGQPSSTADLIAKSCRATEQR